MKIISWNCNCKFREKYKKIIEEDADVYIIQECEDPQLTNNVDYKKFASNYLWIGQNKSKGLGIFAKDNIKLERLDWDDFSLKYFLPVRVNDNFNLLGVWSCNPYIKQYYDYQNNNFDKYDNNMVIMGDFNSNKAWDYLYKPKNHTAVTTKLKEKGLESVYHYVSNEVPGQESQATFYMYRHEDKGFHIDHCFCNLNRVKNYLILNDESWLKYSDHKPIMLEI